MVVKENDCVSFPVDSIFKCEKKTILKIVSNLQKKIQNNAKKNPATTNKAKQKLNIMFKGSRYLQANALGLLKL